VAGVVFTLVAQTGCGGERNWVDDGVLASTEAPPPSAASAAPPALETAAPAPAAGSAAASRPAPAAPKPNARPAVTTTTLAPVATVAPADRAPLPGSPSEVAPPPAQQAAADRPAATASPAVKPPPRSARWLPAEGRYVYDLSGTSSPGRLPSSSTLAVSSSGPNRQRWSIDAKDQQGEGWQEAFGVEESPDGLLLSTYRLEYFSVARVTIEFDLSPSAVFVPRPMTLGRKWAFDAVTKDGCYRVHSEGVVSGVDNAVSAGAAAYQADVLDTTNTLTTVGPPSCQRLDLRQSRRTSFDRASRLVVRDEIHNAGTFAGFPFQSDVTALLRSTQPA
jgi:hypothetical protein